MAAYFADTSFWIALSRERDQYHGSAMAWNRFLQRSKSTILTTEAVLWEWLNALSDPATRQIAALGYHRVHTIRVSKLCLCSPSRSIPQSRCIRPGRIRNGA